MTAIGVVLALAAACGGALPQAQPQPQAKPVATPKPKPALNLTGTWVWKQGQESLDLNLKQEGASLTGRHVAVGQRGMKVDEVAGSSEPSITGELKGTVATVKFRSGFPDSTGGGTATLTQSGNFLMWRIVRSDGEHYLPKVARLTRKK